jgi:hypothetical protein
VGDEVMRSRTNAAVSCRLGGGAAWVAAHVGAAALALTLVVGVLAGATSATSARSVPSSLGRCQTPGLVVWLDTSGNGTAGSTYYNLQFTNLSGTSCELSGFPGVSAVGLTGEQVGAAAGRSLTGAVVAVRLAPGATSTSVLQLTDVGNFPSSTCHEVLAGGLRVYPPGATASKLVPYPFEACSSRTSIFLHIRSVGKGVATQ